MSRLPPPETRQLLLWRFHAVTMEGVARLVASHDEKLAEQLSLNARAATEVAEALLAEIRGAKTVAAAAEGSKPDEQIQPRPPAGAPEGVPGSAARYEPPTVKRVGSLRDVRGGSPLWLPGCPPARGC